ncbi:CPBP family intramembrane glutamic endopeptidase [Aquidulcibacter sp.]|uniref:CPBP family intramembrane glutamic endopeptidase n=1 Tax=Aquidulcibacter sp. TaxID=2052990 RepID=UPI0025BBD4B1|nr:type II CAAX endopeptidase family protein [Aquidulcibacter sp.]MCA3693900.1 CPBP family intramembrane metalloprotease [Aquidulcibacter sp.]
MSEESPATPRQAGHFLQLMQGNRSKTWRTIAGGIGIFLVWQITLIILALAFEPLTRMLLLRGQDFTAKDEALGALGLMVGGFGPAFLALLAWRHFVEKASVRTLFTGESRFRWPLALAAALAIVVLSFLTSAAFAQESMGPFEERIAKFSPSDWLLLAGVYVIGTLVQATFEEVYIRGWLLQHIHRFIAHGFVSVLVTAAIFSMLHIGHPGWATYVVTFAMGLAFGYSAWRLNGLEAAIGGHVANNFMSALLLGTLVGGNPAEMDLMEGVAYALYLLGFLGFVEAWARFGPSPARRGAS